MAGTSTKKELIDFLWEWAEPNGNWGKLLLAKTIAKQDALSDEERNTIFNYYLEEIGFVFNPPLAPIAVKKPTFSVDAKKVVLNKVHKVKGVNLLDEDQEMEFSRGITVVYGNNGVGKTGYSRVLKSLGHSFDSSREILSNVNEAQQGQSCVIDYEIEDTPNSHHWNGVHTTEDLSAISVFNSDCVNISLGNNRELLVAPQGFYMFRLVKDELAKLEELRQRQVKLYPTTLPWKEQLHTGTPQHKFVDELSVDSDLKALDALANFTPEDLKTLQQKEEEAKGMNKGFLLTTRGNLNLHIMDLGRIIAAIKQNQGKLSPTDWSNLLQYNEQLQGLNARTQVTLSAIAEQNGVEKFNTPEFSNFLKSADAYIKVLNKQDYPKNPDDTCVYCKQSLSDATAQDLVQSYQELMNDTTQSEINRITILKNGVVQRTRLVDTQLILHHPVYGVDEAGALIQPKALLELNSKMKTLKSHVIQDTLTKDVKFDVQFEKYITILEKKKKELEGERDGVSRQLDNLLAIEKGIQASIAELKDRQLLSQKKQAVIDCQANLRAQAALETNANKFNSASLSAKTTSARQELIAQDFNTKFDEELKKFRKSHLGVKISFYTSKGSSRLSQNISTFNINQVLSEGEQKAIALAEFLTEMQLDETVAPVVFDDPVNSLDHHIIDDVARRLVELANERQVVVFTHSILLYHSLMDLQKLTIGSNVDFKFYNVHRNLDKAGILTDGFEINSLSAEIKKINMLLNNGQQGRLESDVAEEGYGYLRAALELFVTDVVFQKMVKRYRKHIMTTTLPRVSGQLIDKHKATIEDLFARSSKFINAHSAAQIIHSPPTLDDLRTDFETFKGVKQEFPS
ncbi:AAA family ATPase [Croceitalea sp. MTPC9]|uniref:AAA family ATPase n=1 Tax=unclassified Croceitalea TaxID=2632280 RepID=UPI002B3D1C18|nr:AAA family ATPase [Croceitalea sp. MTPC6]GMN16097.1 AAA family ATPase [Croceitalea sp. MTPC9]